MTAFLQPNPLDCGGLGISDEVRLGHQCMKSTYLQDISTNSNFLLTDKTSLELLEPLLLHYIDYRLTLVTKRKLTTSTSPATIACRKLGLNIKSGILA